MSNINSSIDKTSDNQSKQSKSNNDSNIVSNQSVNKKSSNNNNIKSKDTIKSKDMNNNKFDESITLKSKKSTEEIKVLTIKIYLKTLSKVKIKVMINL